MSVAVVNLEAALNCVNNFINIDSERKKYANNFQALKNQLFAKLQEDFHFKQLFNGHCLQGSYADNLKITLPDEFDSVFQLKLPFHSEAIITPDANFAGNVLINLTEIFNKMQNQKQYNEVYKKLKELVTPNNFLLVEKVQSWLQGCIIKALHQLEHNGVVVKELGTLTYSRTGPAHCIKVAGAFPYSVDFVPGILFEEQQSVVNNVAGNWHAIAKSFKPHNPESISFRVSYYDQEAEILENKQNLKNALRMLKKFRNSHPNMANLKSYYIKTIFLWKTKTTPSAFWSSTLSEIVIEMFDELEHTLTQKELPYYWNVQRNLYENYNSRQLDDMLKCVYNAKFVLAQTQQQNELNDTLLTKFYAIFLTKEEQKKIHW